MMDRTTAIQRIKRILTVKSDSLDMYDKEALKLALSSLEVDEAYQLEYENPKIKLMIEIPKEEYKLIKKGLVKKYSAYQIYNCISNGTIVEDKETEHMNFNTIKQELHKKIKKMSEDDFKNFIMELKRIYYKEKR